MFEPTRRDTIQSLVSLLGTSLLTLVPTSLQATTNQESIDHFLQQNAHTQYPLPQGVTAIKRVHGGRDYGARRWRHGRWQKHNGIDLFVPQGTSVYPIIQGIIASVTSEQYAGRFVTVQSLYPFQLTTSSPLENAIIYTDYMHLQTQLVRHGQSATFHTILGKVGRTGVHVSGPHLHIQMYTKRNGAKIFIDPRKALITGSYYSIIENSKPLYLEEFQRINNIPAYARTTL